MTIKGVRYPFDSGPLILAPLSLGVLEDMADRIAAMNLGVLDKPTVATVIDITHASLLRNYPQMTREEVRELLDVANMQEVAEAAMDVSGIKRKAQEAAEGEAPAPSTGANSSHT